jgi:hypothetical protein
MAQFVRAIDVTGCAGPTTVQIHQVNGDMMSIAWLPAE